MNRSKLVKKLNNIMFIGDRLRHVDGTYIVYSYAACNDRGLFIHGYDTQMRLLTYGNIKDLTLVTKGISIDRFNAFEDIKTQEQLLAL
jgi:hypothetical protein